MKELSDYIERQTHKSLETIALKGRVWYKHRLALK